MMTSGFHFAIDPKPVQQIVPLNPSERFEGIDFSRSGNIMAIATSETNSVLLFKRKPDGWFEDAPFQIIGRLSSGLDYPHDVSFSRNEDAELLAVAQRTGAIAIYEKTGSDERYGPEPAFEISSPRSQLAFSDGVAFVPPNNDCLAVCNLQLGTVLFFRRISLSPVAFEETPCFELRHPSVFHPDGLAFSRCGRWLATANHGNRSVSIFQRRDRILAGGKLIYGPEPVTVIQDRRFRYPHSVAFTPRTNHLIVTNGGANYFNIYQPTRHYSGIRWSQSPVAQVIAHDDETFQEVNTANKMEGGPKGVAIHKNILAVCSPQIGVKIYSFRERRSWSVWRNEQLPADALKELEAERAVRLELVKILAESEVDRAARLDQINILNNALKESEVDRAARLDQTNILTDNLKQSEADREARLEQINVLANALKESEADRATRLEQINILNNALKESETDRAAPPMKVGNN